MKKHLISIGLLALLVAGCSKEQTDQAKEKTVAVAEKTKEVVSNAASKTADAAVRAKDAIADKMTEWKLSPTDIKEDFQKTGRVVRSKSQAVGQRVGEVFDDARVVTAIKAKYVTDSHLSAFAINIDADKGAVTLNGTVKSLDHAGRAMALALDTEGVTSVISLLRIEP
jgi:hypothetical protein